MKPIGGYFSLELSEGESYHPQAIALNTGRNCLEYIMRCRNYRKVYIPYYTCEAVMEPFQKLDIPYEYYHINERLEIAKDISLGSEEALLYTNYFGLKQTYVERLARQYGKQLIVDNTQAFYAKPIAGVDTFYSCRKFFGVPDGAYLYTDAKADFEMEQDVSCDRVSFLMKRLDLGAEAGYADFQEQSKRLVGQPIKRMSNLTEQMMNGIDYRSVAQRRKENYKYLHQHLTETNQLSLELDEDAIPMVYPYLTKDGELKQKLIDERIYVPTYWPNVLEWIGDKDFESLLVRNTCFLPIDQRCGLGEMERIVNVILR
jgi:hypothetical protein